MRHKIKGILTRYQILKCNKQQQNKWIQMMKLKKININLNINMLTLKKKYIKTFLM